MLKGGVKAACSAAESVNLAFYQNAVPIVRELTVENATGGDVSEIEVRLPSEPPFVAPGVWRIEKIADKDVHHLRVVDLKLDHSCLQRHPLHGLRGQGRGAHRRNAARARHHHRGDDAPAHPPRKVRLL